MEEKELEQNIREELAGRDDLLKNPDDIWPLHHPLSGHCYIASEAFYHLTGGKERWQVERISIEVEEPGSRDATTEYTHWYLREQETGDIVDLTAEQFTEYKHDDITINYDKGTPTGFLTGDPSKRAQKLISSLNITIEN